MTVPSQVSQVLLLVSGEIHEVSQQERLHTGQSAFVSCYYMVSCLSQHGVKSGAMSVST